LDAVPVNKKNLVRVLRREQRVFVYFVYVNLQRKQSASINISIIDARSEAVSMTDKISMIKAMFNVFRQV